MTTAPDHEGRYEEVEGTHLAHRMHRVLVRRVWGSEVPDLSTEMRVTRQLVVGQLLAELPSVAARLESVNFDANIEFRPSCMVRLAALASSSDCTFMAVHSLNNGDRSLEVFRCRFEPRFDWARWDRAWFVVSGEQYGTADKDDLFDQARWLLDNNGAVLNLGHPLPLLDAELTTGEVNNAQAAELTAFVQELI